MAEYNKPWLTIVEQLDKLERRGIEIGSRSTAASLLARHARPSVTQL
ncbi:hypothetical protein ACPPVQ_02815 [Diaminobutyricibacter sp. McL0618]